MDIKKLKDWYNNGLWTKKMVWNAVGRKITEAQYKEVTGEEYNPNGINE